MTRLARLFSFLVLAIPFVASCGGGGGSSPPPPPVGPPPVVSPPPPPPADISGTWYMQSSGMVATCGRGIWLDGWATEVIQNGDQASFMNSDGSMFTGTVGEMTVQISGSFPEPYENTGMLVPQGTIGDATITDDQLTIDVAAGTIFGSMDWQWIYSDPGGGGATCDSSSLFFLRRDGQEADTEINDDIPIAQPINIIANDNGLPMNSSAGWVAGSVDFATDEFDVFEFTIAARSRLELELSHFDPTNDDLDIEVYDSLFNSLALSETPDSLEMLEVDLDPGTYYIEVEAFLTPAPANYVLSIDLNEI